MRIQCVMTRSFLRRYVDNDVGGRLRKRIQAHLDGCAGCRDRAQALLRESSLFGLDDVPSVSADEWEGLWDTVLARLERQDGVTRGIDRPPFGHMHSRGRYALVAAAVALLVAGAVVRLALAGSGPDQTPIASYIQYHEAAVDGHVLLENHFLSAQVLPVSYTAGK